MNRFFILLALLLIIPGLQASAQNNSFGFVKGDAMDLYNTGREMENQGRMQDAQNYYDQAIKICNEIIAQNDAGRDTYTALLWTLLRQKKYDEVITWGERVMRYYNDEYRLLETMGEAYFYLNDYENSLKFMQQYVNLIPGDERVSIAYFFTGEIYRIEKKYMLADMAYSTAVRLQPGIALWWYRLGQVREYSGEPIPAADAYGRAVKLTPDYQAALDGLGRVRTP
ncbi:MAG: tetratricopeptide repeat protein [Treponema sp.]|nr:tetratricopeptide repeat protein [Treponema sp.]